MRTVNRPAKPDEVIKAATASVKAGEWRKIDAGRLLEAFRLASLISAGRVEELPPYQLPGAVEVRSAMREFCRAVLAASRGPTVRRAPTVGFWLSLPPLGGDFQLAARLLTAARSRQQREAKHDPLNAPTVTDLLTRAVKRQFPGLAGRELGEAVRWVKEAGALPVVGKRPLRTRVPAKKRRR